MLDHTLKSDVTTSRLEAITETGRRRWFSKDDKARIVEETLAPAAKVTEVARRNGVAASLVFTWIDRDRPWQPETHPSGWARRSGSASAGPRGA